LCIVRDEFENKRAELEGDISKLLGTAWTIDINPNAVYAYAEGSYAQNNLGGCLTG
jgi:hypothetical protein